MLVSNKEHLVELQRSWHGWISTHRKGEFFLGGMQVNSGGGAASIPSVNDHLIPVVRSLNVGKQIWLWRLAGPHGQRAGFFLPVTRTLNTQAVQMFSSTDKSKATLHPALKLFIFPKRRRVWQLQKTGAKRVPFCLTNPSASGGKSARKARKANLPLWLAFPVLLCLKRGICTLVWFKLKWVSPLPLKKKRQPKVK